MVSSCAASPTFRFPSQVRAAAYLSSFWKLWSPRSRSLKRKRGGSGGTSLSCCSILRVEMSKITPLRLVLVWSGAAEELGEGDERKQSRSRKEVRWEEEEKCKSEGSWRGRQCWKYIGSRRVEEARDGNMGWKRRGSRQTLGMLKRKRK